MVVVVVVSSVGWSLWLWSLLLLVLLLAAVVFVELGLVLHLVLVCLVMMCVVVMSMVGRVWDGGIFVVVFVVGLVDVLCLVGWCVCCT